MTIKEITFLRKNGRLKEALFAAEEAFSIDKNNYTSSALFWCLNDLHKLQTDNEAQDTFKRMLSLYNDYCLGDSYMMNSIKSIERSLLPHYCEIKKILDEIKQGADAITLCKSISLYFDTGDLDEKLYEDYGWIIYYALKQTDLNSVYNRKVLLFNYLKLNLPRPSILHSCILSEAVKVEQNTPLQFRIRDFFKMWGSENLREEDWSQYTTKDGKALPSLVEKLVGVYAKEIKTDQINPSEEFSRLLNMAIERFPNNQNLPYFKSIVLIAQGLKDEALSYYKTLILKSPSKVYLWENAADIVDNFDIKIGLLCKAVTLGNDEKFLGGARLSLAACFIKKGLFQNAKNELDIYKKTYDSNGWNLKKEYMEIADCIPLSTVAEDNTKLYSEYLTFADEFIYSSLACSIGVKVFEKQIEDHNKPGHKITLWKLKSDAKFYSLKKPRKYGLNKTPNGAIFSIRELQGRIVWIKELDTFPALEWLKEKEGCVNIRINKNGNKYAIIDNVYIEGRLLNGISDGEFVKIRACSQEKGRWTALSLKHIE